MKVPKVSVLAFDPGKTTGVALIENGELIGTWTLDYHQDLLKAAVYLEEQPWLRMGIVWVAEDFRVYPWKTQELAFQPVWAGMALGVLDVLVRAVCCTELVRQPAGMAKQFATDERLKKMGLFDKPKNGHERDALRHAVTWAFAQLSKGGGK